MRRRYLRSVLDDELNSDEFNSAFTRIQKLVSQWAVTAIEQRKKHMARFRKGNNFYLNSRSNSQHVWILLNRPPPYYSLERNTQLGDTFLSQRIQQYFVAAPQAMQQLKPFLNLSPAVAIFAIFERICHQVTPSSVSRHLNYTLHNRHYVTLMYFKFMH